MSLTLQRFKELLSGNMIIIIQSYLNTLNYKEGSLSFDRYTRQIKKNANLTFKF